jgi:hypothetical protein
VDRIESFLLGVIGALSGTAGLFFLKFWRDTKDRLFLAFAIFFLVEMLNRTALILFVERPNEGAPAVYVARLIASAIIVAAILRKNLRR